MVKNGQRQKKKQKKPKWKEGDLVPVNPKENNKLLSELTQQFPNIPYQVLDVSLAMVLKEKCKKKIKGNTYTLSEEDLHVLDECDKFWQGKVLEKHPPVIVKGGVEIIKKNDYQEKVIDKMVCAKGIEGPQSLNKLPSKMLRDEKGVLEHFKTKEVEIELLEDDKNYIVHDYTRDNNADTDKS